MIKGLKKGNVLSEGIGGNEHIARFTVSKCIKIAVFTFLTAFVFGLLSCGYSHASDIPTPGQYKRYLGEQADAESLKLKEHLSKMPRDKKQRLISYFFDPDKIKNIYSTEIALNSKKILYNGDFY